MTMVREHKLSPRMTLVAKPHLGFASAAVLPNVFELPPTSLVLFKHLGPAKALLPCLRATIRNRQSRMIVRATFSLIRKTAYPPSSYLHPHRFHCMLFR